MAFGAVEPDGISRHEAREGVTCLGWRAGGLLRPGSEPVPRICAPARLGDGAGPRGRALPAHVLVAPGGVGARQRLHRLRQLLVQGEAHTPVLPSRRSCPTLSTLPSFIKGRLSPGKIVYRTNLFLRLALLTHLCLAVWAVLVSDWVGGFKPFEASLTREGSPSAHTYLRWLYWGGPPS